MVVIISLSPVAEIARHTPALTGVTKIRALSIDSALLPHFGDAITKLASAWVWSEVGDSVDDIVSACKDSVEAWYSDMLIGSVATWLSTPPDGWLLLDGSTHAQDDYPELFAVLDDALKSGTDFTLPDTENAFPFSALAKAEAGQTAGENVLQLTVGQLPAHTHTYTPPTLTISAETPVIPIPTAGIGAPIATGSTGSGDDIDRRPLRFGLIFAVFAGRT